MSSEEIRREIEETRARIDQDIDALQGKLRRTTDISTYTGGESLPLVAAIVAGIGLIVALAIGRRRDEPPRPPASSRRGDVAALLDRAEDEGLLNDEARKILIGLLTTQGARWLQEYLAQQGSETLAAGRERVERATADASEAVADAAHGARERASEARERGAERVGTITEAVPTLSNGAGSAIESAKESLVDRAADVAETLAQAASEVSGRLESAREKVGEAAPEPDAGGLLATVGETLHAARDKGKKKAKRARVKAAEAEIRARHESERAAALAQKEGEAAAEQGRRGLRRRMGGLLGRG